MANACKMAGPLPRVLHVVIAMNVGGAEKLVFDMVRHPTFAEHRPVVCCLDAIGELGEKLMAEGYPVYLKNRKVGLDFSVIPWLVWIIRKEKIDVVHAHQYSPFFYATPAAFLAGRVKMVYTEHGRFYPERKSWKRNLFNPLLACGVDHLVSISEATRLAMAQYDNLPLQRIEVIHNGVDLAKMNPKVDLAAKRSELGLSQTCRIIGTAARLDEIKNIPMMLRALALVVKTIPDACLVIAGTGPEEARLKECAAQLGLAEKVKFIGLRFDMPEVYQLFEVFLLTSFSEGISVTLLEAAATGVPSVVTAVGGNNEVAVEDCTGYLVPVDADTDMAQRITQILLQPRVFERLRDSCQERVKAHFSFNKMLASYRRLYVS